MLIDSHCHLDYFEADMDAVLARAAVAGVTGMVTIGVRLPDSHRVRAIADAHPNVWCTVGVHPQNAGEHPVFSVAAIVAEAAHPKVVGIGESGLDYFHETAPRDAQQQSFRHHIRAARETGLPLCIHARDADDDIAEILEDEWEAGAFRFLLHCFSSGPGLLRRALALGAYVSFSGILTFPKSSALRDMARDVPPERLLVETDAPYLAPAPFRGKRNEPAYVAHTARVLGEVRGMAQDAIGELTSRNFKGLFTRAVPLG